MKRFFLTCIVVFLFFGTAFFLYNYTFSQEPSISDSEEGFDEPEPVSAYAYPRLKGLENWTRPLGPLRVGIQVGHWNAQDAPEELINLRTNTGAFAAGIAEWEVNKKIAEETKKLLEKEGLIVDLLPTTIPPNYWADLFIAIHADGNENNTVSGFKVAAPRRDYSGKSAAFVTLLEESYEKATKLKKDPNITRNMTGYYAFNWRKYDHSIHPKTPSVILETGFITNAKDRKIIVRTPEVPAKGIADAVMQFFTDYFKE